MPPKRKAAKSSTAVAQETDFSGLKIADLKAECTKRGLEGKGKKNDLVQRLEQYEKQQQPGGKKIKTEDAEDVEDAKPTMKDKLMALAEAEKASRKSRTIQVDKYCRLANVGNVVEDYDCMLNQTNIGHNNNKYYVIQVIEANGRFYAWNRWGRVGEPGANAMKGPMDKEGAIKDFEKKFKDKTKNDWKDRDNFKAVAGKYTLLEMDTEDEADGAEIQSKLAKLDKIDGTVKNVKPCKLDKPTQAFMKLIFDNDMFKEAMAKMDLDVKKMPLGKLSKAQIAKGFEVLEEIEEILSKGSKAKLTELTSKFYTLIPHNFGRQRPPVIDTLEILRKKMDMLLVLGDIEIAQTLKNECEESSQGIEEVDHPLDVNYSILKADLEHLSPKSEEYKIIEQYTEATKSTGWYGNNLKILDVWKCNRHPAGERFSAHDNLDNRKLLWHGTNVAVVVAILKSGLRIMPHSGGRVGKGIYLASENGKSAGYVGTSGDGTGIMFLCEAALGKEHHITRDNSSLVAPPKGFDSIVAKGQTEPDPTKDTSIDLDGKKVVVPQGKPKNQQQYKSSSFWQSEYLLYKESQVRIRYVLKMKF